MRLGVKESTPSKTRNKKRDENKMSFDNVRIKTMLVDIQLAYFMTKLPK